MGFFDAFFKEHQRTKSEEIYDKALQIFNSPELQNQALSGKLADKVTHGEDCDIIPGSYGRFGHDRTNPIPVNGPSGEFVYLSRLRLRRTEQCVHDRVPLRHGQRLREAVRGRAEEVQKLRRPGGRGGPPPGHHPGE